eukprot:3470233-Lingulodinium_polyedra.AAC.1
MFDHLEEEVSDKTLRDLFSRQVEKSKVVAEDFAHYKRAGKRHDDHSSQFLRDAIERVVDNSHQKNMVEERRH